LVLVLGLEFARQGTTLAIIDADPNAVIADRAARRVKVGLHVPFHDRFPTKGGRDVGNDRGTFTKSSICVRQQGVFILVLGLANPDAFAVAPGFESVNLKASVRQFVN
jgi:hypothetical protein